MLNWKTNTNCNSKSASDSKVAAACEAHGVGLDICWILLVIVDDSKSFSNLHSQESIASYLSPGVPFWTLRFFFQHDFCSDSVEADAHDHGQIASNSMLDLGQGSWQTTMPSRSLSRWLRCIMCYRCGSASRVSRTHWRFRNARWFQRQPSSRSQPGH